jgi:hypothetical protein
MGEAGGGEGVDGASPYLGRHGRARPGHPRLCRRRKQDVDARRKAGHDEARDPRMAGTAKFPLAECPEAR